VKGRVAAVVRAAPALDERTLLAVAGLTLEFRTRGGIVRALEDVSFHLAPGEFVGVVGESGSGKSVTAYALLGLLDRAGRVTAGRALYRGVDLLALGERERRGVRGREIAMIFQSPRAALNPIRRIGAQIEDVLRRHEGLRGAAARSRAVELLAQVKISDPERRLAAYPFELSGGTCQRVLIALALACRPSLLIADEPTTGLDVTTQAAVMDLLRDLAADRGMATLFITHDLALAADYSDRLVVMHAGHVVEDAPTAELFRSPRHPYTARLVAATPATARTLQELAAIPGTLPDLRGALPPCRYSARCERPLPKCNERPLEPVAVGREHRVACWNPL
jgi:peptide/nickel transport system ATP-binding protein